MVNSGALFSACGLYRHRLWRYWNIELPALLFIMLNPSTANDNADDATIRKCIGFAERLRCGGIEVVNLYDWCATKPANLWRALAPVSAANDSHVRQAARTVHALGGFAICAWGNHGRQPEIDNMRRLLADIGFDTDALRLNADGSPAHPLMLPYECATNRVDYRCPDDILYAELA